jgi:hypothetical protein
MKIISASLLFGLLIPFSMGQAPVDQGRDYAAAPAIWLGQPAPETEGGRFAEFGDVVINNRGDMAFGALISGSRFTSGVFLLTQGEIVKIALNIDSSHGEQAPGTDGGVFAGSFHVESIAINNLGQVAFSSAVSGGTKNLFCGIFLFDGATLTSTALYPPLRTYYGPLYHDSIRCVSLNDIGEIAFLKQDGVHLCSGRQVSPIASVGQPAPGTGSSFSSMFGRVAINNSGQIAFQAHAGTISGIFLYSAEGTQPVALTSKPMPVPEGKQIDFFDFQGPSEAGEVVFSANRVITPVGPFRQEVDERFGLYLFSMGQSVPVAVMGQTVPEQGSGAAIGQISEYALSPSGSVVFTAWTYGPAESHYETYAVSQGVFTPLRFFLDGNPPANGAQPPEGPLALNDHGAMLLSSYVPPRAWGKGAGFLLAIPFDSESIPADDFETVGGNGLPSGWPIEWSNAGNGAGWRRDSNGRDSYSGSSVLRLHVGAGGGGTFVLSGSIPVIPDKTYGISVRMRYALPSDSDVVAFSVLQYDAAGNEIGINELDGNAADNRWTWKQKAMFVRTTSSTRSIRVRFGLVASREAYADFDDLH